MCWQAISNRVELVNIGVSDFSAEHLKRLLALVDSKSSAAPLRKPTITQLNLPSSAAEPTGLLKLTQSEGINLQTHADDLGRIMQAFPAIEANRAHARNNQTDGRIAERV
jgi:diketogulonate reductase-like aldo/keto reductase